ncbi:MAG TPA: hypothetical protein VER04_28585, partial [Polyangiaceae bacterium]|nr:hypothetical protein [Polyangiaceae bacterium]
SAEQIVERACLSHDGKALLGPEQRRKATLHEWIFRNDGQAQEFGQMTDVRPAPRLSRPMQISCLAASLLLQVPE